VATASSYSTTPTTTSDNGSVFSVTVQQRRRGTVSSDKAVLTVEALAGVSFGHVVIVMGGELQLLERGRQ